MSGARRLLMAKPPGGGGVTDFFGHYSMFREMWAEDPDWTNPGNGNDITTIRDNGSAAKDWTGYEAWTGYKPNYVSSGINGKPAVQFVTFGAGSAGGYLRSADPSSTPSGAVTVVCVADVNVTYGTFAYLTDAYNSGSNQRRSIIGWGAFTANKLAAYHSSTTYVDTPDSNDANPHVFVAVFKTDDTRLYVDGTLKGTDTGGTYTNHANCIIGANNVANGGMWEGHMPYFAWYEGDLTAESDYADWLDVLGDYYSITIA